MRMVSPGATRVAVVRGKSCSPDESARLMKTRRVSARYVKPSAVATAFRTDRSLVYGDAGYYYSEYKKYYAS